MPSLHEQAKKEMIDWLRKNSARLKDRAYELGEWENLTRKDRRVIKRVFDEVKYRKIGPGLKIVPVEIKHEGYMLDPFDEGGGTLAVLGALATVFTIPITVYWLSHRPSQNGSATRYTYDKAGVYDSCPLLYPLELDTVVPIEYPSRAPTHLELSSKKECPTFPGVEEI